MLWIYDQIQKSDGPGKSEEGWWKVGGKLNYSGSEHNQDIKEINRPVNWKMRQYMKGDKHRVKEIENCNGKERNDRVLVM